MKGNNGIHCLGTPLSLLTATGCPYKPSAASQSNNNTFTNTSLSVYIEAVCKFNANFSLDGLSITNTDVFCPLENIQQEFHLKQFGYHITDPYYEDFM